MNVSCTFTALRHVIISSGAEPSSSPGFAFYQYQEQHFLTVSTLNQTWLLKINSMPPYWTHVTFTWSKQQGLKFYENGTLVQQNDSSQDSHRTSDASVNLTIGTPLLLDNYVQPNLQMYDLTIWQGVISQEQILQHFMAGMFFFFLFLIPVFKDLVSVMQANLYQTKRQGAEAVTRETLSITALKNLIVVMVGTGAHRTLKQVKLPSMQPAETVLMKQIKRYRRPGGT